MRPETYRHRPVQVLVAVVISVVAVSDTTVGLLGPVIVPLAPVKRPVPPVIADNPVLAKLWTYWQAKRGARSMPRRSDIDPAEIAPLLPHLQLVERIDGRYRYRLCGTAISDAYGSELTGRFVDEIIPVHRRAIAEHHYRLVYDGCRPIFVKNKYTTTKAVEGSFRRS